MCHKVLNLRDKKHLQIRGTNVVCTLEYDVFLSLARTGEKERAEENIFAMLARYVAILAFAGSAEAFSPMMSMETGRRQVVQVTLQEAYPQACLYVFPF